MDRLEALHRSEELSLYRIENDKNSGVEEYIFSTPETREVCNKPEMVGFDFPGAMRRAHGRVMGVDPLNSLLGQQEDYKNCVMHFLRGGLNFQLREALADAFGFNRHYCSYMTSQRYQRGERWKIKQDQYRKINFNPGSTLLIGDCIATGSTMENGLQVMLDHACDRDTPFENLVIFTIGCGRGREILEEFHKKFKDAFDYNRTLLFYAEGRFGLADEQMDLTISLPGTDLLREPALLTPEYEYSIYRRLHIPIERCAIYDVGAKSFEYRKHLEDVIEYWQQLIDSELTLKEAYRQRWSEKDYGSVDSLLAARKEIWPFVNEEEIKHLHGAYNRRWDKVEAEDSHRALEELARDRISTFETVMQL